MSKPLKSFYEATRYLGQYIGKDVKFLKATSCMGSDRRIQLALIEWLGKIEKLDLDKLTEKEILSKVVRPLIQLLGYAEWRRDTVTDMALRKGIKTKGETWVE